MSNVLFIGGLCSGRMEVSSIENAFERAGARDVTALTDSSAGRNPDKVERLAAAADMVVTHSKGLMRLVGVDCSNLTAIAPPIDGLNLGQLLYRGNKITAQMIADAAKNPHLIGPTARFFASYVGEALIHPIGNFRNVVNGEVGEFDGARQLSLRPRDVSTGYISQMSDVFFPMTDELRLRLSRTSVRLTEIAGGHNRLLVEPDAVLVESGIAARFSQDA